jgi:HTH-type transcriptional regulator/antitoxin HigA
MKTGNTPLILINERKLEQLKYKVIKTNRQYLQYCRALQLLIQQPARANIRDEIELLMVLIQQYDEVQEANYEMDPIQLIKSFMKDHKMNATDLVELLGISKGYVSDILNYKKGLSKEVIRKLSGRFKVRQEAFNRPYSLINVNKKSRPAVAAR